MKNLDPTIAKQLLIRNKLGPLTIFYKLNIGEKGKKSKDIRYTIDMSNFFSYITQSELFGEKSIGIEDIHSICIFGSVLYRHIPIPFVEQTKIYSKKGNIEVRNTPTKELPRPVPNDIDLLVILNKNVLNNEKEIIESGSSVKKKKFNKRIERGGYGGTSVYWDSEESEIPLHICFRTVSQFLKGINNEDRISEYVSEFGLPIIGQNNFNNMLKKIKGNRRRVMHRIKWEVTNEICSSTCVSKWWVKYSLKDESARRNAVVPPEIEIEDDRFQFLDV